LAWQLLFFIGCTLGYTPRRGPVKAPPAVPFHWALALGAGLVLLLGAAALTVAWHRPELLALLPERMAVLLTTIDKTSLHPFRLLSILALAYLLGHAVALEAAWLRSSWAAPFVLMGQHGLPVFCAGIFLSFLGRLALEVADGWAMQLAVNLAGLAAMVGIAVVGAWYRREAAAGPRPGAAPVAAPARGAAEAATESLPVPGVSPRTQA